MKHVKLFEDFLNEAGGLDHLPANPAAATATGGFLKTFIGDVEYAYRAEYAKKFAKTRSEKELSFMESLECAKTPNRAFESALKEVEKMISWHEREIKKQGVEIKKVIKDSKELKDPNTKKAMAMAEELSQNIGIDGAGKPSKIKYRYTYEWADWDLTPSDELACDKFIADIFKEWEAEAAKAEKMDAKFSEYVDTIELASYNK